MANYSFVVDSSFQPFTMQELMVPVLQYKDAYEKTEEAYDALNTKAGDFAYLSKTLPEGSQARQIYEGYAKDLEAQAKDLASKGLSMGNKRALVNLKRRYQGEIGRLEKADKALQEEKKLRRDMLAKDSSMLFADDNLDIDKYLDGSTPNNYSISGNELYTRGVNAAKSASSRMFNVGEGKGRTLGGYYRDWVERRGITPEMLREFGDQIREDFSAEVSSLPGFQQMANGILEERGVNENLSGYNLRRAQASVINGLIDGAIYEEKHNPVRDLGVMTASEKAADARARESLAFQKRQYLDNLRMSGLEVDAKGNLVKDASGNIKYDPNKDVNLRRSNSKTGNTYNPDYISDTYDPGDYEIGPDGKPRLKNPLDRVSTLKDALSQLDAKDLMKNKNGFSVELKSGNKSKTVNYKYLGVLYKHKADGSIHAGIIGKDNPNHKWWGMGSNSNVENAWGDYSMSSLDNGASIVPEEKAMQLASKGSPYYEKFRELFEKNNLNPDTETRPWALIRVPREDGLYDDFGLAIQE